MNAAIVCIAFGGLIVVSRLMIVVAPATTMKWLKNLIGTTKRVRTTGLTVLVFPVILIWVGISEETLLAQVLLILGLFLLFFSIPWLVFFPQSFIELANWLLPSGLMAWRVLGLLGAIVGLVLVYVGWRAL